MALQSKEPSCLRAGPLRAGPLQTGPLRAGHLPAVMAGGKRVAKKAFEDNHGISEKDSKRTGKLRPVQIFKGSHQVSVLLSGSLDKLGHDFPETPVSVRHGKARPVVEKHHGHRSFCIQQPRKSCSSRGAF